MLQTQNFNTAAQIEANHEYLRAQGKDVSGRYMQKLEQPVTTKQAKAKLTKLSSKASAGTNRALEMESW